MANEVRFGTLKRGDVFWNRHQRYTKTIDRGVDYIQCNARLDDGRTVYFTDVTFVTVESDADREMDYTDQRNLG